MVLLARRNAAPQNIDYKRLGMRKNLHEITDLLLDETPRDTRERLKPTQINRVVRAHRCRRETATARRLLVVAAAALAAKGRIETCSG